jgi:hypothetical protein
MYRYMQDVLYKDCPCQSGKKHFQINKSIWVLHTLYIVLDGTKTE